uniref:Transmembrane protein 188 n=1 Tax=Anisakis simplex TaxID=6269 RepID=A0A0M3J4F5_ANISI
LKLNVQLSSMDAGAIVDHHLASCGITERIFYSTLLVFVTWAVLALAGFRTSNQTVWYLMRLSMLLGSAVALNRCLEMQQRLYPTVHEGFYIYYITFLIGLLDFLN